MAANYLLGYGERLIEPLEHPGGPSDKQHPYGFSDAQKYVSTQMRTVYRHLAELPEDACPGDEAVALLTLHPTYLAKSYYPHAFLRETHLRTIGSRPRLITPRVPSPNATGNEPAAELFVAAERSQFAVVHDVINDWTESSVAAEDLRKIEEARAPRPEGKIRTASYDESPTQWEVVLHADASRHSDAIVRAFADFTSKHGGIPDVERRLYAGGLCFLPVAADASAMREIVHFAFVRVARGMPRLRPITRVVGSPLTFDCTPPNVPPLDPTIRAAVFDGGPVDTEVTRWVTNIEAPGVSQPSDEFRDHGIGVTSAFLFGPIEQDSPLPQPFCNVDVVRVLDEDTHSEGPDYFTVLQRIVDVLESRQYDFVNLSIGPDWPIEDDEPHAWTAVLDQCFCDRKAMAFCAVGNNGEKDWDSGNARIQPPADCVSATAVGSCDAANSREVWGRSAHSCIGPGRSPGFVKPDMLAFGGSPTRPFFVLGPVPGTAVPVEGTSYACPTAMRVAAGVRARLGSVVGPLAIKALMINRADPRGKRNMREVGWGRMIHSVDELLTSDESTAHIIYQSTLEARQWIRVPVPLPAEALNGNVYVTATVCYYTETDPHHPVNYTRAGLDVIWRPHVDRKRDERQKNPDSQRFFSPAKMYGATEAQLRANSHKWETVLHYRCTARGSSLKEPCFDIHYNPREESADASRAPKVPFALVLTVASKKEKDLYNRIARRYRTVLQPLQPVRVPIRLPG